MLRPGELGDARFRLRQGGLNVADVGLDLQGLLGQGLGGESVGEIALRLPGGESRHGENGSKQQQSLAWERDTAREAREARQPALRSHAHPTARTPLKPTHAGFSRPSRRRGAQPRC